MFRFMICWSSCRARGLQMWAGAGEGARAWRRAARPPEGGLRAARAALTLLHVPAARAAVAFPHPRLLQYDCGE